ncbi:Protein HEAT-INDUCED TAS1 TARGET 1 [Cardamine amara subsp. amara]|uniref:Protein HEAT-INDUCED TAS1 TARGET 1 n=1 Tax=Cardamine amara subsp. amara TaxID=228776 RepID=A0ABD1C6S7_CARAN
MNDDLPNSAGKCHPDCVKANNEQEDYDASQSAAFVAVSLISSARVLLKLDSEYTEYSAQYLVDNAGKEEVVRGEMRLPSYAESLESVFRSLTEDVWHKWVYGQGSFCWVTKKKDGQGSRRELTVKDCLEFAFKEGLPTREHWLHFGCMFETPPFQPLVPMKGQVVEAADLGEGLKLCTQQPVGARLHVFSPEFDIVGEEGIYDGPSYVGSRYVGLRDAIIVAFDKREGNNLVTVQILYKKKTSFVKVSGRSMILPLIADDGFQVTEPTCLLVDFCVPRLSIN